MAVADTWTAGADWATNEKPLAASKLNQQIRDNINVLRLMLEGDASGQKEHRHLSGVAASRPAAGNAGRTYYATDTKTHSIDNGTTWDTPVTIVRKTAQEIVTSSTTLQDDDELFIALAANETWAFELLLIVDGPSAADIKVAFTVPSGATLTWSGIGVVFSGSSQQDLGTATMIETSGSSAPWGLLGGGTKIPLRLYGTVVNAGNAGNLQLQWAQKVSSGSGVGIYENSWMKAHTIA